MCTIVLLRRPGHAWPLVIGANRDEMLDRPWRPPGRHWPGRPDVIAGLDVSAGGTWLGVNGAGLVAAVSNRWGSLGPAADRRSRGELPLIALEHASAAAAAGAISALDGGSYRAFNLVVADRGATFWLRNRDEGGPIERFEAPDGVSMITAGDLDDPSCARTAAWLPAFRQAAPPDPERGDWRAWEALLAARQGGDGDDAGAAMAIVGDRGFGTVSSSLIALPAGAAGGRGPIWRFAAGLPGEAPWRKLTL